MPRSVLSAMRSARRFPLRPVLHGQGRASYEPDFDARNRFGLYRVFLPWRAPDAELFTIAGLHGRRPATTAVASRTALHAWHDTWGQNMSGWEGSHSPTDREKPILRLGQGCTASNDFAVRARSGNNEAATIWVLFKSFQAAYRKMRPIRAAKPVNTAYVCFHFWPKAIAKLLVNNLSILH